MNPSIEKILKLPGKQKIIIVLLVSLLIGAGFFFGLLQPKLKELKIQQDNLGRLRAQVQESKRIADQLPKYRKAAGLDFLLFRPKPEEAKGFYAAVPVDISVSGSFYNVANFFVAVGNLPRIVNISNVAFPDIKYDKDKGRTLVKVTCLATTFRFLDKKEIKNDKPKK
jgi:type IV pilus assembly protein PilO